MKNNARFIIGIDPGTHTGLAVYDTIYKCLRRVESKEIHKVMFELAAIKKHELIDYYIRIEDARLRKWFGKNTIGKDQGAGSIKRDCKIWEDFLKDYGFQFEMVNPKSQITKITSKEFNRITGWQGKTNEHMRDSAMLVFGYKY